MNKFFRYKDFIGTVEYSAEDEVFYGKIHGIEDLVLFEGDSVKQLKLAFEDAVQDYLDFCKEYNKIPEKSYKGSFNIRISPELHKAAARSAAVRKQSLNEFVKQAIQKAVD